MRLRFLLMLLIFIFSFSCFSKEAKRVHYQNIVNKYFLDCKIPTMQEIINQQEEEMKPFIKYPLYVKGDFNGDRKVDFSCICVKNEIGKLVLFERGKDEKYKAMVLDDNIPGYAGYYLDTAKKGELLITLDHRKDNCESADYVSDCYEKEKIYTPKNMVGEGLIFGMMESAASIFYWDGKKYEQFWFAD